MNRKNWQNRSSQVLLATMIVFALSHLYSLDNFSAFGQSLKESDLQVVSFSHDFDPLNPSATITFTLTIVNNGPDILGPGEFTNPAFPHLGIQQMNANNIDWSSCEVSVEELICVTRDVENGNLEDGVFTGVSDFSFTLEPGETITLIGSGSFREITTQNALAFSAQTQIPANPTTIDPNTVNNSLSLEIALPQCDDDSTAFFISDWACATSFTNQISCQAGTVQQDNDCIVDPAITEQINQQNSLITQLQDLIQTLQNRIAELEAIISGQNQLYCGLPESAYLVIMRGTEGNDKLVGTSFDDLILGFEGNDKIIGKKGNDCLIGGPGNDDIQGNQGNDNLSGNGGDDKIHGGQGNDILAGDGGIDACHGGQGNNTIDPLTCETIKPIEDEDDESED